MQAFTYFSLHAFRRVSERTQLTCEEIAAILDSGLGVPVGRKPGMNRNHILFYSQKDDDYFVAIQDEIMGAVVTVLPLDFHASLAWKVVEKECQSAKRRIQEAHSIWKPLEDSQKPSTFIIAIKYVSDIGKQKTKELNKISSKPYNHEIANLLADKKFPKMLDRLVERKKIDSDSVFGLSIRHGRKGQPVYFELRDPMEIGLEW